MLSGNLELIGMLICLLIISAYLASCVIAYILFRNSFIAKVGRWTKFDRGVHLILSGIGPLSILIALIIILLENTFLCDPDEDASW